MSACADSDLTHTLSLSHTHTHTHSLTHSTTLFRGTSDALSHR